MRASATAPLYSQGPLCPLLLRMAAVSIPASPHTIGTMANRRVPLANVPNAANSPFRAVAAAASKRSRPYNTAADEGLGEQPPAKRQVLEFGQSTLQTPLRRAKDEERIFNKRTEKPHLTAFDRKLLAAKDTQAEVKVTKQDKTVTDDHETLRQWQKHYRKAFPAFVFYFESLPEDMRRQCSKRINGLGAVRLDVDLIVFVILTLFFSLEGRKVLLQGCDAHHHNSIHSHRERGIDSDRLSSARFYFQWNR